MQSWEEQLTHHLQTHSPDIIKQTPDIVHKIPSHYKSRSTISTAAHDLNQLLNLTESQPISFHLTPFIYPETSDLAGKASHLLVYHHQKLDLTHILPILHNLGIHVIDQLTSRFGNSESTIGYIHAFRILDSNQNRIDEAFVSERLIATLHSIYNGSLTNDSINSLVLSSSLTTDHIFILQAFRNYLYQVLQSQVSLSAINHAICKYPTIVELFIQQFMVTFEPKLSTAKRNTQLSAIKQSISSAIESVDTLANEHILATLGSLLTACVRCNWFIKSTNDPISLKFNCSKIIGMPTPIPYREIFVFDALLEGVHIRFGKVSGWTKMVKQN